MLIPLRSRAISARGLSSGQDRKLRDPLNPDNLYTLEIRFPESVSIAHSAPDSFMNKTLEKDHCLRLRRGRAPVRITAVRGRVWITSTGCLDDIALCTGQSCEISRRGTVVIQALSDAEFRVQRAASRVASSWLRRLNILEHLPKPLARFHIAHR